MGILLAGFGKKTPFVRGIGTVPGPLLVDTEVSAFPVGHKRMKKCFLNAYAGYLYGLLVPFSDRPIPGSHYLY